MTIDYVVNQVEALVKKVGSRDPYVICNELDFKLHYIDFFLPFLNRIGGDIHLHKGSLNF